MYAFIRKTKELSFLVIRGLIDFSQSTETKEKTKEFKVKHSAELRTFGDQKAQVNFLINHFFNYEKKGLPKNGFFVDLACADGIYINNTFFLEKYLGWSGLLFEVNPTFVKQVKANRSQTLITKAVSSVKDETVSFRIDNGMLGGIVDNASKSVGQVINVETTTLWHELQAANAPKIIDFMSLDIEGHEYEVMKDFPFDNYKFKAMTIELPSRELDILLDANGYVQIAHLDYDVFYCHREYLDQVNFDPRVTFRFTFHPRLNDGV